MYKKINEKKLYHCLANEIKLCPNLTKEIYVIQIIELFENNNRYFRYLRDPEFIKLLKIYKTEYADKLSEYNINLDDYTFKNKEDAKLVVKDFLIKRILFKK